LLAACQPAPQHAFDAFERCERRPSISQAAAEAPRAIRIEAGALRFLDKANGVDDRVLTGHVSTLARRTYGGD
jgi:hypothetical protein